MKEPEHHLLLYIESLPNLDRFLQKIFKNKAQKRREIKASIEILHEDAEGRNYLQYLSQLFNKEKIELHHVNHFFEIRKQGVPEEMREHYGRLAEVVLSSLLFSYSPQRIDHSALYLIADFFIVRRVDFILIAPAVFQNIVDPQDLTPPLVEKLCEILIEHYHIEDVLLFLVICTDYGQKEMLKITHALSFGQKLYRKKREKRHRLLDKNKVSKLWFQMPYKKLRRFILQRCRDSLGQRHIDDREIEATIEKAVLKKIIKKIRPACLQQNIDEQHPAEIEKLGLELVLLRNNEDVFASLIADIGNRGRLEMVSKYVWQYMHLLRIRSLHEDQDKEKILRVTVQHAFEEIRGTTPVILYIEDNGRYQDEFTRHVTFECHLLELMLPKIIVYRSVGQFRQQVPKIIDETKDALAHIFIVDGVLADGTWRNVLESVKEVEKRLWEKRKETLYSVKYVFTGDIDIAREAYQAKILDHAPVDGVFIKPLESWDDAFLEIALRARKTGIQTDDVLYQRIVTVVKEVMM